MGYSIVNIKDHSAVLISNDELEDAVIEKMVEEKIPIFTDEFDSEEYTDYIMIVDIYYEDMYEVDATGADLEGFGDFCTYARISEKWMKIYKDEAMTQLLACFVNEPQEWQSNNDK